MKITPHRILRIMDMIHNGSLGLAAYREHQDKIDLLIRGLEVVRNLARTSATALCIANPVWFPINNYMIFSDNY